MVEFVDEGEDLVRVRSDMGAINCQEGVSDGECGALVYVSVGMALREALPECGSLLHKVLIIASLRSVEGRLGHRAISHAKDSAISFELILVDG